MSINRTDLNHYKQAIETNYWGHTTEKLATLARIAEYVPAEGIRVTDLANKLGMTRQQVSRWTQTRQSEYELISNRPLISAVRTLHLSDPKLHIAITRASVTLYPKAELQKRFLRVMQYRLSASDAQLLFRLWLHVLKYEYQARFTKKGIIVPLHA